MEPWQIFLQNNYFNPKHPGAFAGPQKVRRILNKHNFYPTLKNIKAWLQDQDAYSLLRPTRYRFKRQRVVTSGIDDLWDADLADVSNLAQHNYNLKYWLVVIDVFSRKLWVVPVASKHHTHMVQAFKTLFTATNRRPKHLRTDKGTEFTNRAVKKVMRDENIDAYTTKNETKANYAERVIRTLKGLVYRYFHHKQTYVYTDVLQQLVDNYNQRPHRSLNGLSPDEITTDNESQVWKRMYVDTSQLGSKRKTFAFKVGDQVRISHLKYTFQRDYQQKWTEEVFRITKRLRQQGFNLYQLKDLLDEPIDGYFYEVELQHVTKDASSAFRIEKVLKRRKRQGHEELYVKWMGWPNKFNSWVQPGDIQKY